MNHSRLQYRLPYKDDVDDLVSPENPDSDFEEMEDEDEEEKEEEEEEEEEPRAEP